MSEESTTPDLLELVRRAIDAANARDIEAAARLNAPDTVYVTSPLPVCTPLSATRGVLALNEPPPPRAGPSPGAGPAPPPPL